MMHAGNGQLHQFDKSRQLQCRLYLAAKNCRERRFHCPSSITPAFNHCRSSFSTRRSLTRRLTNVSRRL